MAVVAPSTSAYSSFSTPGLIFYELVGLAIAQPFPRDSISHIKSALPPVMEYDSLPKIPVEHNICVLSAAHSGKAYQVVQPAAVLHQAHGKVVLSS